jgi:Cu2+-exporting ATPase
LIDVARPESAEAVRGLAALGLAVRIASGDRPPAVAGAAHALAIPCFEASMLPEEKLARVRALQSEGHRVLMVGDGINDGPVLAAADVSVAMAAGSSIAHAAADVVLLRDTLLPLPRAIALARRTLQIMRQNLAWAFAYNIAAVPLAALGLVPPWVAALGMSASSLLVVLNARRLTRPRGATPPDEFGARQPLAAPVSP